MGDEVEGGWGEDSQLGQKGVKVGGWTRSSSALGFHGAMRPHGAANPPHADCGRTHQAPPSHPRMSQTAKRTIIEGSQHIAVCSSIADLPSQMELTSPRSKVLLMNALRVGTGSCAFL